MQLRQDFAHPGLSEPPENPLFMLRWPPGHNIMLVWDPLRPPHTEESSSVVPSGVIPNFIDSTPLGVPNMDHDT